MRRHLLLILTFAILLPALAVLLVSGLGLMRQEWAMESFARSYVQDLAENVASLLRTEGFSRWGSELSALEIRNLRIFTWGPSLPGWIAVVSVDGKLIYRSPGADSLSDILMGMNIYKFLGSASEIKNKDGKLYTVAVNPVSGGTRLVIAAVEWDRLLGPLVRVGRLWPVLIVLMAICILLALWAMWRWLIVPLRILVDEIGTLQWGKDLPVPADPAAVSEIGSLRSVLYRLARTAVERTTLRNRYVKDIVRVQEGEKSRIARELHDGPIQNITAMIQQIRLSRMEHQNHQTDSHLLLAEETAHVVVRELREMCDELSPPWLDLGPEQAMTELADRLSRHFGVSVTVEVDDSLELSREKLLSLFRILQEGVSNAVRHGKASEIRAEIFKKDGNTVFEIKDNGTGFDPDMNYETLRVEGHRGLANMLERMMLFGGKMEVSSKPGEGAVIRCMLPDIPDFAD